MQIIGEASQVSTLDDPKFDRRIKTWSDKNFFDLPQFIGRLWPSLPVQWDQKNSKIPLVLLGEALEGN
jgi:hypothetical protein